MAFLRGRCCKSRKGKSRGDEGVENVGKARSGSTDFELPQSAGGDCTEVDIDDTQDLERDEEQGSTVARVFKNIFHASADSKIALKFYGNKKGVLMERKRQDDECCSRWMIHPCSRFRWYWDMLIVILLVFTVAVLPISIAFYSEDQLKPAWLTINCLVDTLFMSDIFVNFRTGIFSEDLPDQVILAPKTVALKYLKGWFIIDFASSIPFDYLTLIATGGELSSSLIKASRALRVIRLAKLLSLLKLLRISRLLRFMQRWEDLFDLAGGVLRISKLIMMMLLLAHWNGCIQFLVPILQDVPSDSWIAINHLQNATVGEQYSWSLFKAISHMLCIGFGRWPPQNITEVWLTVLSMMVGATFYALFIGNMSTLLLSIDSSGRLYNEKLSQVEEYMRYRKLPQTLRERVQEYYEYRFRRKCFNEQAILEELSQGLREDVVKYNCQELVESVPFFENASPNFVTAVLTKLKFEVFLKGEYIIHEGTKGDKMYFIQTGVVDVLTHDNEVATRLSGGSHFGEICLLTDDRRVATIRAATICDLFSLSKQNFQSLLDEYPEMRCALETVALSRLNKIGKSPVEDVKKRGRISTTIPPPHISKDALVHSQNKDASDRGKSPDDQPSSSANRRKKISTVDPPIDFQPLQEADTSKDSDSYAHSRDLPLNDCLDSPAASQDPHLIEYSDSKSNM